jgi:hypothetical protein
MHLVNILRIITISFLVGHSILTISDFNSFRFFGTPGITTYKTGFTDSLVRDRIICGMCDNNLRENLLN